MRDTLPDIGSFVALGDSFTEGVGDPYPNGAGHPLGLSRLGGQVRRAPRRRPPGPALRQPRGAGQAGGTGRRGAGAPGRGHGARPGQHRGGRQRSAPVPGRSRCARADVRRGDRAAAAASREVLVFTGFDPRAFPLIRLIRGKVAVYNMHLRVIADRRDCRLVDLWSMRVLGDPREWSADRLHLGPDGHRRVALRVCEVMGVTVEDDWREPLPPRLSPEAARSQARCPRPPPGSRRAGSTHAGPGSTPCPGSAGGCAASPPGTAWRPSVPSCCRCSVADPGCHGGNLNAGPRPSQGRPARALGRRLLVRHRPGPAITLRRPGPGVTGPGQVRGIRSSGTPARPAPGGCRRSTAPGPAWRRCSCCACRPPSRR